MLAFFIHLAAFAVEIEFVVKGLETDAEQLRGARLVILRLLQRAHEHLALDFFERRAHRQGNRVFISVPFALIDWVWSEVMPFNLIP